jgi:hypothetical protein
MRRGSASDYAPLRHAKHARLVFLEVLLIRRRDSCRTGVMADGSRLNPAQTGFGCVVQEDTILQWRVAELESRDWLCRRACDRD